MRIKHETLVILAMLTSGATVAHAQVPPQIAKQLVAIGRGVCTAETAPLYLPLHQHANHAVLHGPQRYVVVEDIVVRHIQVPVPGSAGNVDQNRPRAAALFGHEHIDHVPGIGSG